MINLIEKHLLEPEEVDIRYANSPFKYLKQMQARAKGSRMEKICSQVLATLGFDVKPSSSTEHDIVVDSRKIEIKGATLAKGTNNFSFLQIRPSQDYDGILFALFYPDKLEMLVMEKEDVVKYCNDGTFTKQHLGNGSASGTFLYYGNAESLKMLGAKDINEKNKIAS